jgi:heptosyltransferase II
MKVAIFLPNWVGDAVMATPAIAAIRRYVPTAELIAIGRPVILDVLAGTTLFDRTIPYHPRSKDKTHRGWNFGRTLRDARCETAILFPNSLRSGLWGWLSGARRRIGFQRDLRGWLLTDGVTPRSKATPHPVLDEYNRLATTFGCPAVDRRMRLAITAEERQQIDAFWSRQPAGLRSRRVVTLNSGGAFGPAKNWPREFFVELAQRIVDQWEATVLVVCGPAEQADARAIVQQANRAAVISLADERLSIGLTKAAIATSSLLVTTDSGPRHFATAFDVPSVALFGPTHIAWSETCDPRAIHLQQAVDCGPCQQRSCPLGHHRCMRELTVDRVFQAVVAQWSTMDRRAA